MLLVVKLYLARMVEVNTNKLVDRTYTHQRSPLAMNSSDQDGDGTRMATTVTSERESRKGYQAKASKS